MDEQLAAKPTESIPAACGSWGDTAAAYRLLYNSRCDWRKIFEARGAGPGWPVNLLVRSQHNWR